MIGSPARNELCSFDYRVIEFAQNAFGRLIITNNEQTAFQVPDGFDERLLYQANVFVFAGGSGSVVAALDFFLGFSLVGSLPIYSADFTVNNLSGQSLLTTSLFVGGEGILPPIFPTGNSASSIQFSGNGHANEIGLGIFSPIHLGARFDNVKFRFVSSDNNVTSGTLIIGILSRNSTPSFYGQYPF